MNSSVVLPSLFVSHGSPMIALEPGAAGAFLQALGNRWIEQFGRPDVIVTISAHTIARVPALLAAARHQAVHDFGNFDSRLHQMRYDAAGAPALAERLGKQLADAGLPIRIIDQGGLDHGAWTALRYLFPRADIPILPLAFVPTDPPQAQFRLGEALTMLRRENVLILGSGSMTHNLQRVFAGGLRADSDRPEIPQSREFRQWFVERSAACDWPALFDYRQRAPHAVDMHPSDEHLLPWFVAAGAAGRQAPAVRLHDSVTYGALGMDVYAFGESASALADPLEGA